MPVMVHRLSWGSAGISGCLELKATGDPIEFRLDGTTPAIAESHAAEPLADDQSLAARRTDQEFRASAW